jgi:hypothetical protein
MLAGMSVDRLDFDVIRIVVVLVFVSVVSEFTFSKKALKLVLKQHSMERI